LDWGSERLGSAAVDAGVGLIMESAFSRCEKTVVVAVTGFGVWWGHSEWSRCSMFEDFLW